MTADGRSEIPSLGTYYVLASVAGILGVAVRVYLPTGSVQTVVGVVLDAALIVLIVLGVLRIGRTASRVPLRVSVVGIVYGLVSGLGAILVPPSLATVRAAVENALRNYPNVSQSVVQQAIARSMTLSSHIVSAVTGIVVLWLLALLVAWITSLFVKKPGQSASV